MTPEQRIQRIESYGLAHTLLVEALLQFPREMWQFKPSPADWSIHEIVVHIADSEANSFVRCRRFIAEPGSTVMGYDQDRWANALNYHDQSIEDALELFRWLRLTSYRLIRDLPDSAWSSTIEHSESGTMRMDDWLLVYERHIPDHIEQMKANHQAWLATHLLPGGEGEITIH
jgi:hypothetical protein